MSKNEPIGYCNSESIKRSKDAPENFRILILRGKNEYHNTPVYAHTEEGSSIDSKCSECKFKK